MTKIHVLLAGWHQATPKVKISGVGLEGLAAGHQPATSSDKAHALNEEIGVLTFGYDFRLQ